MRGARRRGGREAALELVGARLAEAVERDVADLAVEHLLVTSFSTIFARRDRQVEGPLAALHDRVTSVPDSPRTLPTSSCRVEPLTLSPSTLQHDVAGLQPAARPGSRPAGPRPPGAGVGELVHGCEVVGFSRFLTAISAPIPVNCPRASRAPLVLIRRHVAAEGILDSVLEDAADRALASRCVVELVDELLLQLVVGLAQRGECLARRRRCRSRFPPRREVATGEAGARHHAGQDAGRRPR
jgi:hypothetical protein